MAGLIGSNDGISADKKPQPNKDKIVGEWKLTKTSSSDTEPVGSINAFSKDGKYTYTDKAGNVGIAKGTYEVNGDTLTIKVTVVQGKREDQTKSAKIKSLTDKEMVLEAKSGEMTETMHFSRAK
jgi:uncharacterized protein (TIGR03066 family)